MTEIRSRERLRGGESDAMKHYISAPGLSRDYVRRAFPDMMQINLAHVMMLGETGIIDMEHARLLTAELLRMQAAGPDALETDTEKGDLHYNIEAAVIKALGMDVGGRMHTARSRNDLKRTSARMRIRGLCLGTMRQLNDFRETVIRFAGKYAAAVMPAYTHSQPAQPITLGHYFAGLARALERDFERLVQACRHCSLSPLGAGAAAGVGFPIDRERTAELLGFDGVMDNTVDAIAARDHVTDYLGAVACLLTTLSRIAQDLYTWSSFEYGFLEVDDALAGVSSIMPQKKNPLTLEHIKVQAARAQGELMTALSELKATPYTHNSDSHSLDDGGCTDRAAGFAESVLVLFSETLDTLIVHEDRMLRGTRENFCCATELADALTLHHGLAFREAHQIVGRLVAEAIERGLTADRIPAELAEKVALEVTGRSIKVSEEELAAALDPQKCVEKPWHTGSPSPEEVKRVLAECAKVLEGDRAFVAGTAKRLQAAAKRLKEKAEAFARG